MLEKSKVNALVYTSWKHELAMLVFAWTSASQEKTEKDKLRMSLEENLKYKAILLKAACCVGSVFSFTGEAGTNLQLAQEHDGPVIVIRSIFPEIEDRPNTEKLPDELLRIAEDKIKRLGETEFERGVLKAPHFHLGELRKRWFCQHYWEDSQYPDEVEGGAIVELQVCRFCGTERVKNE